MIAHRLISCLVVALAEAALALPAQSGHGSTSRRVVFWEAGFPTIESVPVSRASLQEALGPAVSFVDTASLRSGVPEGTALLVLPYGSAFPVDAWSALDSYVKAGGGLLIIGGEPFRVPVLFAGNQQSKVDPPQDRFSRALGILHAYALPNFGATHFAWRATDSFLPPAAIEPVRSFALEGRLNGLGYLENGAGERLSAPVVVATHGNGRSVYLNFEPAAGYWDSDKGISLLRTAAAYAAAPHVQLTVDPLFSTLRPGELPLLSVHVHNAPIGGSLAVSLSKENRRLSERNIVLTAEDIDVAFDMPAPKGEGFYTIAAQLASASRQPIARYENAFWVASSTALDSGPTLSANASTLTLDGQPFLPVGTNYFSTESNGWNFGGPRNAAIWEHDFADMEKHNITFVRTGVWGGQFKFTENGQVTEQFLRNVEAYLLCARHHHIAVNFTFFAFDPQTTMRRGESNPTLSLPGSNPYLDPVTVRAERSYMLSIVNRFKTVPDLSWDLINEPSFANPSALWHNNTPNGDAGELHAWHEWLKGHYPTPAALASVWSVAADAFASLDEVPLPVAHDLALDLENNHENMLRATDYNHFAQDAFSDWVAGMVSAIRATGSKQIIDVGQDEGGVESRVLNQFFAHSGVAFTTNHTYRQNQNLLWDSWAAKAPGIPNIVGETGYQPVSYPNGDWHFDEFTGLSLLEKKWTAGFAAGTTGFLSWDWDREIYFGLLRSDGSEKLWQDMTRSLGDFARRAAPFATFIEPPQTAIVLPQSLQLSVLNPLSLEAQKKAVNALYGVARSSAYAVGEDQLDYLGDPKLIILPSPWVFADRSWEMLLGHVRNGATLLLSGRFDLGSHFEPTNRPAELGLTGYRSKLLDSVSVPFHSPAGDATLSFSGNKPDFLQDVTFGDSDTFKTVPLGRGYILLASEPLEWNDNLEAIGAVYRYAATVAGVKPSYSTTVDDGAILICPTVFPHATLYALSSQSAARASVEFRDERSGRSISGHLDSGRSALLLVRDTGELIAAYNWP